MDELVTKVRQQNWMEMIRAQKKSGLSVKEFCKEVNITVNTYYYRQNQLRKAALSACGNGDEIKQEAPVFAELKQPEAQEPEAPLKQNHDVVLYIGKVTAGINNTASADLIRDIIEAMKHAE